MKFFDTESNKKVIQLLQDSNQDWRFDPSQSKPQLLVQLTHAPKLEKLPRQHSFHILRYGLATATVVVLVSGTFAFATSSKPGDLLFPLNKFGEQMILSLPLSAQTKADFHTHIVTNRLQALDQIETQATTTEVQADTRSLATIKESDDTINEAIETISASRESFQAAGQMQAAANLSKRLNQLEMLAQQHEKKIQALVARTNNAKVKLQIQNHLTRIHRERTKAILEVKINDDYENDTKAKQPNN